MQKLLKRFPEADSTGPKLPGSFVTQQAAKAGLIFGDRQDLINTSNAKEDQHLGNISHTIMKIRLELNNECQSKAGNVVQHSDYGGNPFGTIDYPLIFFVPDPGQAFKRAEVHVAEDMPELKGILRNIQKKEYILQLNPAWSVPLY